MIIYDILIFPVQFLIETLFYIFKDNLGFSYGISVVLLSIAVNIISTPLYNIAEKWQKKESDIKKSMQKELDLIKRVFKGDERYLLARTCYRLHNYNPVFSIRSVFGLLIQIPFFIAAYNFLHNLPNIENQSFLMIKDLSKPDSLIITINILPFIMAFFSFMSGYIYSKGFLLKEKLPLLFLPLFFLIILYNSPSILLIYWTLNTLYSLIKNIIYKNKSWLKDSFIKLQLKKRLLLKLYLIISSIFVLFILMLNILSLVFNNGSIDELKLMHETKAGYVYRGKFHFNKILPQNIFYKLKNRELKIKNYGDIKNYSIYIEGAPDWHNENIGKIIKNDDGTWTAIRSRSWNSYGYIIPLIKGEKYKIEIEAKRVNGNGGSITYYFDEANKNIEIPYSYGISEDYKVFTDIRKIDKIDAGEYPHFNIYCPNGEVTIKYISIEQLGNYLYLREDNSVIFNSIEKIESVENIKYDIKVNSLFYYLLFIILLIYPIYILILNSKLLFIRFAKRKYLCGFLSLFILFLTAIVFYYFSNFNHRARLTDLELIESSRLGYIYKAKLNFKGLFSTNLLYNLNKNSLSFENTNDIKSGFHIDIRRMPDYYGIDIGNNIARKAKIDYNFEGDGYIASNSVAYNAYNFIMPISIGEEYSINIKAKRLTSIMDSIKISIYLDDANKDINIPIRDNDSDYKIFSVTHKVNNINIHPLYPQFSITYPYGEWEIEYLTIEEISGIIHVKDDNSIVFTSKDKLDYIDINYNIIFNKAIFLYYIIFSSLFILFLFKDKINDYNFELNKPVNILISSTLSLTILTGIFIITSLIASSPTEFESKYSLIFSNIFKYTGIFFVYPIILYYLFSKTIKNILLFIMPILALISLSDVFLMNLDYGNISSNFRFDNADLLISSLKDTIFNILLIISSISFIIFAFIKKKYKLIINIFLLISFSLLIISFINMNKIIYSDRKEFEVAQRNFGLNNGEDVFNVSKNGTNIFVITLDRAIPSYWYKAFEQKPELKKEFDGFTFYLNNTSFAWNTVASIHTIYGGYEYMPYEISTNGKYKLKDKYNEAILMTSELLKNYEYQSVLFNIEYPNFSMVKDLSMYEGYTNIKAFNDYNDTYKLIKNNLDFLDNKNIETNEIENIKIDKSFKFSIFKIIPAFLRYDFYNYMISTLNNGNHINVSIIEYAKLLFLKYKIKIHDSGNFYNNFHSLLTHFETHFNSDYLPSYEAREIPKKDIDIFKDEFSARSYYVNMASIDLIIKFINFLKNNNIYDNTKIILVSDHGVLCNTDLFAEEYKFITSFHSLLLVKDFNDRNEFKINSNFMTIADVPYLAVNHLNNPINPFTGKIITNDAKNNGINVIKLNGPHPPHQFENSYNFSGYWIVKDNVLDPNNWKEYKYKKK